MSIHPLIDTAFQESIQTKQKAYTTLAKPIIHAVDMLVNALEKGHKILSCGNGGSASDALHFAAELVNRFQKDRRALAAIALTADISTLTSIANDFNFDQIFARQVEALGQPGDILLAISTSGQSPNIIEAVNQAHRQNMRVIALTGKDGGPLIKTLKATDCGLCVPSSVTARIQEVHLLVIHCLCEGIEHTLFGD